jgi:hypothetical protein
MTVTTDGPHPVLAQAGKPAEYPQMVEANGLEIYVDQVGRA